MPIAPGTRLGPFEILAPLGAGGMGEVYRARDTRLGRDVALKVLPEAFAQDAQRMQRFQREAQLLASLNHPNIATIHGLEESGATRALVMELVEGPTLADRISHGAVPVEEALPVAKQIAEALEYAHDRGIIHRDLKPANVKLTADGKVKVLDFGLAKALDDSPAAADVSTSPTLTAAATRAGIILGTAAYMSPEQAKGRPADRRADIWSFGVVLYEMLAGARAFPGDEISETLAGVIKDEPDWKKLPGNASPRVRELLRRCLTKDPARRLQAIGEARISIEEVLSGKEEAAVAASGLEGSQATRSPRRGSMLVGGIVLGAVVLAAATWLGYSLAARQQLEVPLHVQVPPPEKVIFDATGDYGGVPVISPQGDRLVFSAHGANSVKALWVRPLDSFAAQRLEGTDGAAHPFWSPDGRYIGFFAGGKVNKVQATGGPVVALAAAENPRGGAWCSNDAILFAPNFQGPLMRVSASGGSATPATTVDTNKHTTHRWPSCLPDGKHFLYLATSHQGGRTEDNGVVYAALDAKESRMLVPSDAGALYANGYLLYHAQTSLMAQAFDPASGKLSGEAVAVLDKVKYDSGVWRALFTVSDNGILGYLPGGAGAIGTQLVWYDRSGKLLSVAGEHGTYSDPRLSPDGKQLAFVSGDPIWDVWILDLDRGTRTRVTFDQTVKAQPTWSPDSKVLVFTVTKVGGAGAFGVVHSKAANGSGADLQLASESGKGLLFPQYSPDGQYLVYLQRGNVRGVAIFAKPLQGNGAPFAVVSAASPGSELFTFRISPNGRWVAYESSESGRNEIYIAQFPRGEGKWQVSTGGGNSPAWRGDNRELFFRDGADQIFTASITEGAGGELQIGTPLMLFHTNASAIGQPFDVTRDGQRFLINRAEEEAPTALNLVVNWIAELKKK